MSRCSANINSENAYIAALLKLVNVADPVQLVAVQAKMDEVAGGFGDIYKGRYIVKGGSGPFEYFGNVVAKKNRPSTSTKPESERRQEVR